MKASELRIGNYYNQFGNAEKVSWSTLKTLEESTTEQLWCKPIQLTEEWLLKFGFEKIEDTSWYSEYRMDKKNTVTFYKDDKEYSYFNLSSSLRQLKYVHQLQNLYFALTNEELTYEQQK